MAKFPHYAAELSNNCCRLGQAIRQLALQDRNWRSNAVDVLACKTRGQKPDRHALRSSERQNKSLSDNCIERVTNHVTDSGTGLLGFGVNVLQTNPETAATQAILTPPAGSASKYEWNGVEYTVPNNVSVTPGFGDQTTSGTVLVADSRGESIRIQCALRLERVIQCLFKRLQPGLRRRDEDQQSILVWRDPAEYEAYSLLMQETGQQQISAAFLNDPDVINMIAAGQF